MADDIAIHVENLGKRYQLGQQLHGNLRELSNHVLGAPLRWAKSLAGTKSAQAQRDAADDILWAIRNISFDVKRGEVLGVIGRNGAGKSTLLKILSRIVEPTEGSVTLNGRVGSLLEVGTGFHPELSGKENIFLNGAILGMTRKEINAKLSDIIDFAEIEKFMDTPVKRYSSGMYTRLAFAVAAHMEPEILIVDEVLAVGDYTFQKKCLSKMGEVASEGRTVLLVSHNMASIQNLASTCLVLEEGRLTHVGPTVGAIDRYLAGDQTGQSFDVSETKRAKEDHGRHIRFTRIAPVPAIGNAFRFGDSLEFDISFRVISKQGQVRFGVTITDQADSPIVSTQTHAFECPDISGDTDIVSRVILGKILLAPGHYKLAVSVIEGSLFGGWTSYDLVRPGMDFKVENVSSSDEALHKWSHSSLGFIKAPEAAIEINVQDHSCQS